MIEISPDSTVAGVFTRVDRTHQAANYRSAGAVGRSLAGLLFSSVGVGGAGANQEDCRAGHQGFHNIFRRGLVPFEFEGFPFL